MTYIPDLEQTGPEIVVGYLSREREYSRGEASEAVVDRLVSLVQVEFVCSFGWHYCELGLCGSKQVPPEVCWDGIRIPRRCDSDFLVPDRTVIYRAPTLMLHYVLAHDYLPPSCFLEAALNCPAAGSEEYFDAIEKIEPRYKGNVAVYREIRSRLPNRTPLQVFSRLYER